MVQIDNLDRFLDVKVMHVLHIGMITPGMSPPLDPGHVCRQVSVLCLFIRPDEPVATDDVILLLPNPERRGAIYHFFKRRRHLCEAYNPVSPSRTHGLFAKTPGDAVNDFLHEGIVACFGIAGKVGEAGGAFDGWRLLELGGDFDPTSVDVAENVPPRRVVGKGGIFDASDEARDLQELVDLAEIGIWEGVTGEAAERATGCEGTGGENMVGNLSRWAVVREKDYALLREKAVYKDNDGMRIGPIGSEMGMERKRLRILDMGS